MAKKRKKQVKAIKVKEKAAPLFIPGNSFPGQNGMLIVDVKGVAWWLDGMSGTMKPARVQR